MRRGPVRLQQPLRLCVKLNWRRLLRVGSFGCATAVGAHTAERSRLGAAMSRGAAALRCA